MTEAFHSKDLWRTIAVLNDWIFWTKSKDITLSSWHLCIIIIIIIILNLLILPVEKVGRQSVTHTVCYNTDSDHLKNKDEQNKDSETRTMTDQDSKDSCHHQRYYPTQLEIKKGILSVKSLWLLNHRIKSHSTLFGSKINEPMCRECMCIQQTILHIPFMAMHLEVVILTSRV